MLQLAHVTAFNDVDRGRSQRSCPADGSRCRQIEDGLSKKEPSRQSALQLESFCADPKRFAVADHLVLQGCNGGEGRVQVHLVQSLHQDRFSH